MKHATPATLMQIEPLLQRIRGLEGLIERKPGTFYRRSAAFLHFHEDVAGLFADVKLNGLEFERMPVSTLHQREVFMRAVTTACSVAPTPASSQRPARKKGEKAA